MFLAPAGVVRAQWSFDVAVACQRFVGGVLEPEPEELTRAVGELAKSLPVPESQVERFVLRDRLRIATENAGRQFHGQFHRRISPECQDAPTSTPRLVEWDDFDCTVNRLLAGWLDRYLEGFATSHAWPPPMRAARLIGSSSEKTFDVDRIARMVGCGRSGLIRSFKDAYGISMGEYQTRCRIRSAFDRLRAPDSNVGAIAFGVGYQSTKNFYRALRDVTGMTPTQVRDLSDERAEWIVNTALKLPTATTRRCGDAQKAPLPAPTPRTLPWPRAGKLHAVYLR